MLEETTPSEVPITTRSPGLEKLSLRMVLCTDSAQYLGFKDPETVLQVVMTDGTTLRLHHR